MKKIAGFLISSALVITSLASCKKDYGTTSTTATDANDPSAVIVKGTWSVSSFTQKAEDKTATFSGVSLAFNANGTVTATGASKSASGSWSSSKGGITYYGGPPSIATLTINFASTPFDKISKTWNVATEDNSSIHLDNKEPIEDEHLTLSKN